MTVQSFFTEHPASVGETYADHMRSAFGFALPLLGASLACMIHGVLPFLFTSTASRTVTQLYERMVLVRQRRRSLGRGQSGVPDPRTSSLTSH